VTVANQIVAAPRLSDARLQEVLALVDEADSVELKLTLPAESQRPAITELRLDPLEAQIRQVYFFDTPDLTLYEHGLVARVRRVQGRRDDSVVKLRPVVPAELPRKLRRMPGFGVEVDAMPGGFVCSSSLKGTPPTDARRTLERGGPLRKLFTREQRQLFAERAPEGVELDDLSVLGPIFVLKLRFTPPELRRRFVAELWLYPDASTTLELSTKCPPAEALDTAGRTRAFLAQHDIPLAADQEPKTRHALEYFAGALSE
jgi:hypothetical protein